MIEFGDFVRAVGTYCFFSEEEILRFLFVFAASKKEGFINHQSFVDLINIVNPFEKIRAKRALKEMYLAPHKKMYFPEFRDQSRVFYALFYPAFRLQHKFRTRIIGEKWWINKLRKYEGVRKFISGSDGQDLDVLSQAELDRFGKEKERTKRMAQRAKDIRKERSFTRRAILNARQFLDEMAADEGI